MISRNRAESVLAKLFFFEQFSAPLKIVFPATGWESMGTYPPINVFQQGDDLVAIVELPGVNEEELNIQAEENTLRISGRKSIEYPEDLSLHLTQAR